MPEASSSRANRATTTRESLGLVDDDVHGSDGDDVSLSDADALFESANAPTMSRVVHGAALIAASTARCDLVRTRRARTREREGARERNARNESKAKSYKLTNSGAVM